jgi:hypothetical protein
MTLRALVSVRRNGRDPSGEWALPRGQIKGIQASYHCPTLRIA